MTKLIELKDIQYTIEMFIYPGESEHIEQITESCQMDVAYVPMSINGDYFCEEWPRGNHGSAIFQEEEKLVAWMKIFFPAYQLKKKN